MTVITGNIRDIGLEPLSGTLIATSVEFRTSGDFVVAPESRSWPIVAGAVEVDLLPGPTRLTIQVGSHARDNFDVIVPDEPTTLAQLVEDAYPWTPAVVSKVAAHRQAAEDAAQAAQAARDAAQAAAGSFGLTASATRLAAGADPTSSVSGDGPDYTVEFGIPDPVWAGTADDLPATGTPGVLYAIFEE